MSVAVAKASSSLVAAVVAGASGAVCYGVFFSPQTQSSTTATRGVVGAVARLLEILAGVDEKGDGSEASSSSSSSSSSSAASRELARLSKQVQQLSRELGMRQQQLQYHAHFAEPHARRGSWTAFVALLVTGTAGCAVATRFFLSSSSSSGILGSLSELFFVSRASFRRGIEEISSRLEYVRLSMGRFRRRLMQRVDELHSQNEETYEHVLSIESKCVRLDEKVDFSNAGIHLLCSVVSQAIVSGGATVAGTSEQARRLIEFSEMLPPSKADFSGDMATCGNDADVTDARRRLASSPQTPRRRMLGETRDTAAMGARKPSSPAISSDRSPTTSSSMFRPRAAHQLLGEDERGHGAGADGGADVWRNDTYHNDKDLFDESEDEFDDEFDDDSYARLSSSASGGYRRVRAGAASSEHPQVSSASPPRRERSRHFSPNDMSFVVVSGADGTASSSRPHHSPSHLMRHSSPRSPHSPRSPSTTL